MDILIMRKRDGGLGQQHLLVPLTDTFEATKITEYLSSALPDGVATENLTQMMELGLVERRLLPQSSHSTRPSLIYVATYPPKRFDLFR